ncbi:Rv1535 domain-containing protein [Mycobacterium novum]
MKATEVLAEPLAEVTATALAVPIVELYAVLWRAGVLDVEQRRSTRPAAAAPVLRSA